MSPIVVIALATGLLVLGGVGLISALASGWWWPPGATGGWRRTGLFTAVVALLLGIGLLFHGLEVRRRRTDALWIPDTEARCPNCGEDDLVRGPKRATWGLVSRHTARCLICGTRSRIRESHWNKLPMPNAGDPFETGADRRLLIESRPTFAWILLNAVVFAAASALAECVSIPLARTLHVNALLLRIALFTLACAAVLLVWQRLALPRRQPGRRCVRCGYDLRSCTGDRCSECGEPFDPGVAHAGQQKD